MTIWRRFKARFFEAQSVCPDCGRRYPTVDCMMVGTWGVDDRFVCFGCWDSKDYAEKRELAQRGIA